LLVFNEGRLTDMLNNGYSFFLIPLIGWFATVFVISVGFLGALYLEERRTYRRFHPERARSGLRRF
jgi:hypothetical protein